VIDKYDFIAAERATQCSNDSVNAPTIEKMCRWLGVSKSGFYDWLRRPLSATARRREALAVKIRALFDSFGGIYGYRRIHAELVRRVRGHHPSRGRHHRRTESPDQRPRDHRGRAF
jgi:putative transposase